MVVREGGLQVFNGSLHVSPAVSRSIARFAAERAGCSTRERETSPVASPPPSPALKG